MPPPRLSIDEFEKNGSDRAELAADASSGELDHERAGGVGMVTPKRVRAWRAAAVLLVLWPAVTLGQERAAVAESGSLAALVAEIRALRLAVEESTRAQAQVLGLGVFLTAQQQRLAQASASHNAARKELDDAAEKVQRMSEALASRDSAARALTAEQRAKMEVEGQAMKVMLEGYVLQEQQARVRESELSRALQSEEARWADLTSRLDQLLRK